MDKFNYGFKCYKEKEGKAIDFTDHSIKLDISTHWNTNVCLIFRSSSIFLNPASRGLAKRREKNKIKISVCLSWDRAFDSHGTQTVQTLGAIGEGLSLT